MADQQTLDMIMADTNAALVASSTQEAVTSSNATKAEKLSNSNADLLRTVASNQALVIATQETAKLSAQKATLKAANAVGVDPTATGDVITGILEKVRDSNEKIDDLTNNIAATRSASFADVGPVEWIKAKITAVQLGNKRDQEVQRNVMLNAQLNGINNAIQNTAQTQNAIKESTTAASAEASAATAAALSLIESNRSQIEGLKYNTAQVDIAMKATTDRLQILYNKKNAENQEILLTKQLDQLKLSNEQFEWQKEQRVAERIAKQEGKELDDSLVENINIGRAARGVPPLDSREAKSMLLVLKNKGAGSRELEIDYQNGQRTKIAGIPMLGASPAESVALLSAFPVDVPEARKAVVATLSRAAASARDNRAIDQKSEKAIADFINKVTLADIATQHQRVQSGDQNNVFDIGDVGSYIGLSAVKNLPVVSKILQPAFDAKQPLTDPKVVVGLVASGVKAGTITSSQATDLARVYQLANEVNIASRGLTGFGITVPGNGKSFNAAFGIGRTVNMTDPIEITRILSRDLAQRIYGMDPERTGRSRFFLD